MKEQWETPPSRAFHFRSTICGHKPYRQSKCLLLLGIASTLCGLDRVLVLWVGVATYHIIGFILLQKLKPEIKFEALTLERFVTNNTICIQIHETQCIDG